MAILTINSGSSSLKFALYGDDGKTPLLSGNVTGIGQDKGSLTFSSPKSGEPETREASYASQSEALDAASDLLASRNQEAISAVGHRMVHGGPHLRQHCPLTDQVLGTLEQSVHFAPLHIPPALALVRATEKRFPQARQYACFDTAFHTTMPPEAFTYAIPKEFRDAGVQRYGFHGLSYASLVRQLGSELGSRTVAAHLGGGSSLCALLGGRSVDTSMGLSPCGGVPMATRSGDLDPGVGLLMQRALLPGQAPLTADALESTLNHASGVLALSGTSDMRELTARAEALDADAQLSLAIFTRDIAKFISAYASVLGGLDTLVFTGGIGEHSAMVRQEVCKRLSFLGVELDAFASGRVLSSSESRVKIWVITADEEGEIALEVARMMLR